jgi:hypothetical protein
LDMRIDLDNLPVDMTLLHHLVRDMATVVESRDSEIERLQLIIKKLQRAQFGRRSEVGCCRLRYSMRKSETSDLRSASIPARWRLPRKTTMAISRASACQRRRQNVLDRGEIVYQLG